MNIPPGCIYISKSIYIDTETGEVLRSETAKDKRRYIIIKTTKKTEYNANKTKGYITYTRLCQQQPQRRIDFGT